RLSKKARFCAERRLGWYGLRRRAIRGFQIVFVRIAPEHDATAAVAREVQTIFLDPKWKQTCVIHDAILALINPLNQAHSSAVCNEGLSEFVLKSALQNLTVHSPFRKLCAIALLMAPARPIP